MPLALSNGAMLKIDVADQVERAITVRLEGRIIDRKGVALCRSLRHGRATFTHCSPFVTELLHA